jgi:hypothetical protein
VTERENIIRRWTRLKQAAKVAREADDTVAAAAQAEAETAEGTPFDLASLPSIESIAADTDIVAFLRSEVPAELTRAALRRAWTSDPAIRDFIGIAENQWDFNDPDAIPGFGPLTPMDDSTKALAQVSRRFEEAIAKVTPPGDFTLSQAPSAELPAGGTRLAEPIDEDVATELLEPGPEQDENRRLEDSQAPHTRRRHGGALPR